MNRKVYRAALGGSVAAAALMALTAPAVAVAQAVTYNFDIPSQDLAPALLAFGKASRQQLVFDGTATRGKQSVALNGSFSTEDGLRRMLDGTGLKAEFAGAGAVRILAPGADGPQGASAGGGAETNVVQELVVTAQKKSENIQVVPIAISAFTQQDLTRSQIAGGPDLMTQVPNMTFTKTNFSGYSIQIRGIGTQAISATVDPAVAVAFNNTPFTRNRFFEQEFYDLERVEVLRGPQGTLYGRNATAGVVNIISAKPNLDQFEAKAAADVANYGSKRLEGMFNLPIVGGKAALRLAGAWTKRDGFVKNLLTGEQIDGRDLWSARATLSLAPTDRFSANLIYEHFSENDDRLRSGKQVCHHDDGPETVQGVPIANAGDPVFSGAASRIWFTQGCLPASMYSPDSYQTPNGFALPYGPAAAIIGAPVRNDVDPYLSATQSRDLRAIESYLKPEYTASNDTVELQLKYELTDALTLASETAFSRDRSFSFEDFNRFATRPHTIIDGTIAPGGVICNAQIGCSDRLQAGDLSTSIAQQFSQEFRLSSNFDGRFNFSAGANFMRTDSEDKYYVFINTIGRYAPTDGFETRFFGQYEDLVGYAWSDTQRIYQVFAEAADMLWKDGGDIHHLSDLGRNYFLSKNPYHLLSYAAFGEVYYNLTDDLKLTGGFRWTVDQKQAPQIPSWLLAQGSYGTPTRKTIVQEWREPTGRVAIDWKPTVSFTDATLLYASYVRGYKAGGANPPPAMVVTAPVGGIDAAADANLENGITHPQTFEPEFVNAFEIGTKNTLFDGRMTFNLNAFYYDYTGYQISEIVDRSALNLNFDAKVWGSELEVSWRPLQNLRLAFKGGYEHTRMADGSKAIDLMDRTAGDPNYLVKKPFPTFSSNCIVPKDVALYVDCNGYLFPDFDPFTHLPYVPNPTIVADPEGNNQGPIRLINDIPYPGFDPRTVPNRGEGIFKDLSGNELPNAPHYTATLTADYTLPVGRDWLATLHTDLYYQSEAWTRIFNTDGYDKLKAYNNINVAAIFTNEAAGLTVMAYVKNVLDRDNITGSFLNSDDTGLTTNVFLNEPRLYGVRVTKNWTGSSWWSAHANASGHYPYRLELDGQYGRVSGGHEILAPDTVALFPAEHPYPLDMQNDLDWSAGGGVKFSYQPQPKGWFASASLRYGRAKGLSEAHPKWDFTPAHQFSQEKYEQLLEFGASNPDFVAQIKRNYLLTSEKSNAYNYATTTAESSEAHAIADFEVGKDVGLGLVNSKIAFGLRYAQFNSDSKISMQGRPDLEFPEPLKYEGGHMHRFHSSLDAHRKFQGAGPTISWDGEVPIRLIDPDAGKLGVDLGLGGAVLFGKQNTHMGGETHGEYNIGIYRRNPPEGQDFSRQEINPYSKPLNYRRSTQVTVPGLNANLGLSYTLGGLKLSGGYRFERYFNAIDGGIATRKTYDRQFDGPYFKLSFGFGG